MDHSANCGHQYGMSVKTAADLMVGDPLGMPPIGLCHIDTIVEALPRMSKTPFRDLQAIQLAGDEGSD